MASTPASKKRTIEYSSSTVKRAETALCCSPFHLKLFTAMRSKSVPLGVMAGQTGIKEGYTQKLLTERAVESSLMWLIKVGLLRREVDGQGITDSFRLTPLGKQLVKKWEHQTGKLPSPTWSDRLGDTCNRWLSIPL